MMMQKGRECGMFPWRRCSNGTVRGPEKESGPMSLAYTTTMAPDYMVGEVVLWQHVDGVAQLPAGGR